MNEEVLTRFAARFAGLDRAHGEYVVAEDAKPNSKGKIEGVGIGTHSTPLLLSLFERHLTSTTFGLGVVPIRDDNTCVFGAIDVDVYPVDLARLYAEIKRIGLPLVLCRTKSGGAHLYLFTVDPVPARLVREKLIEWSYLLGYPGSEVFPKQTEILSEKDYGNWINIPYQGGNKTARYALTADGRPMKLEAFLDHADSYSVTKEELENIKPPSDDEGTPFEEGPPCLELLSKRGFPEGVRNNGLFNIAVYLKKRWPEDWADKIEAYNQEYMKPPLPQKDVGDIVKSLGKKDYSFKCKDQPICDVCSKQVCLTRDYGISQGASVSDVTFGRLIKISSDPGTWLWEVNGVGVKVDAITLMNQAKFGALCMDKISRWPTMMKPKAWRDLVQEHLDNEEKRATPIDVTKTGQTLLHLQEFCNRRGAGKSLDELLRGQAYTTEGRTYFKASDFITFMMNTKRLTVTSTDLYSMLADIVQNHKSKIKGKTVEYWSIPAFEQQTEDFEVPVKPVETM